MPSNSIGAFFDVVFVCTGNRARSALAEALYRRYSAGVETRVSSAGTADVGSLPPLSHAVDAARDLGIDLASHRSRPLRHARLADADLVLGFEPFHVASAVVDAGADRGRTFLLGDLVDLLPNLDGKVDRVARAREAVAIANEQRKLRRGATRAHVIDDPLGESREFMARTAAEIDRLVRELVRGLFGAR